MCGICGFIGKRKDKESILKKMMKAICHRGPDSEGLYIKDEAALGFCRLSIIDLAGGAQPMQNEAQDMTLIFNGEIYNYRELRKNLTEEGHHFLTQSDSEVILHGFESNGKKILDMIQGMFAFTIWDEKKKRLFAARDFFGIKPFYYAMIDGCFVFASEIKSILEFPGCKREVNTEALEQYLSFQYSVLNETFFKGIYKLPAGNCLVYDNNTIKVRKYFDPLLTPKRSAGHRELAISLEETLNKSIDKHMISDVEVGAFLSGGIDSSFIAAQFSGKKAFTVGFMDEKSKYSEISSARELAGKLKLEHYGKTITKQEFLHAVPEVMYHMDEPSGDAAAVALYFVAGEAAKQVKVVTSGEGADELFGGYNIYKEPGALRWMKCIPEKLRQKAGRLALRLPKGMKGRNYLIRAGKSVEERFIGNAHIFTNEERRALLKKPTGALSTEELLGPAYAKAAGLKDAEKMQYIDLLYWLQGDILQKADKMSMAHSLELRVPFLDREVFRAVKHLPEKEKIRCGQTKYLFRKTAEKYLPRSNTKKKKLGFPVPIRLWLREEEWYNEVKTKFLSETAGRYFHREKLLKLLDAHKNMAEDNSRKIWTVYAFLVWHQIFIENRKEGMQK